MSFPRIFLIVACLLFGFITLLSVFRGDDVPQENATPDGAEISLNVLQETETVGTTQPEKEEPKFGLSAEGLPEVDRVEEFFNIGQPQLPIVKTIEYQARVDWKPGKAAWLADYSGHFKTSRHFIARSLNRGPDYDTQTVANGDLFTILDPERDLEFYLVVDLSRCKLFFYYVDKDADETVLVKTYNVGLGMPDERKPSGLRTPLGKFLLGDRIAVYRPGKTGWYDNKKIEMRTVFGTRWIPFETALEGATAPAKGFGIHGTPWKVGADGELHPQEEVIGCYESDGCIRLATPDVEELFSIIISRPTTIELVRDFAEASPPGGEIIH